MPGATFVAQPAILLQATLSHSNGSNDPNRRIAGKVTVLGIGPEFWKDFARTGPTISEAPINAGEIVLNRPLADKLNVHEARKWSSGCRGRATFRPIAHWGGRRTRSNSLPATRS